MNISRRLVLYVGGTEGRRDWTHPAAKAAAAAAKTRRSIITRETSLAVDHEAWHHRKQEGVKVKSLCCAAFGCG
jgi:hypothetical protein